MAAVSRRRGGVERRTGRRACLAVRERGWQSVVGRESVSKQQQEQSKHTLRRASRRPTMSGSWPGDANCASEREPSFYGGSRGLPDGPAEFRRGPSGRGSSDGASRAGGGADESREERGEGAVRRERRGKGEREQIGLLPRALSARRRPRHKNGESMGARAREVGDLGREGTLRLAGCTFRAAMSRHPVFFRI